MDQDIIIVLTGIFFFLLTGTLGGLGIFFLMKQKIRAGVTFLVIGFISVIIYVATMFTFI
ncbi:hypothetical protein [Bacillus alkalicellulosilyticus]|uniref:hypothetical protein n=1 Tax=Alkalihalobacterium alkalicellulosilyticum TaxID=1912214 RepID=UPI0009977F8B|nr:hypothetical protein [Bacillus alkalicellulosilyticus]